MFKVVISGESTKQDVLDMVGAIQSFLWGTSEDTLIKSATLYHPTVPGLRADVTKTGGYVKEEPLRLG